MSFPRYPAYKDSGVEWLGEVPGHWDVKRLKHNLRLLTEKTDRRENPIALENIEGWTGRFIATDTEFQGEGIAFSPNDILFGKLRPYLAKAYRAKSSGEAVGDFHVMRPVAGIDSRFAQYQILNRTFIDIVDGSTFGSKMPRASWEFVGGMEVTTPPLPEQTQIATFLDRETAKIDALVAEQRRLMALLKEKRQAVISHVVTRGLNPHAPMKPSGIEWLGDVPEHWDVLKGAMIGTLFGSEQVPEDAVLDEGDLPYIKVGSLSRDSFEVESWDYFVDISVTANYRPHNGYIVFPKRGAAIFTNKVNIVDRPSLIDPNLMGWKIGERAVTAFIAYALKCRKLDEIADVSTVPQINNKHIAPERFAVPPVEEQHQIVTYLCAESAKFDALTAEAQRAIDLLQERRTALISAAVTGQIDVRENIQREESS
jgi:type I restriction enzyme S subunit